MIGINSKLKIDRAQICWGGVDWIHLTQDKKKWRALLNAAMNIRIK
jgi:hypothetical protein